MTHDTTTSPTDMHRPIHLTFLGAGSMFCPRLVEDILCIPHNPGGQFRLVDTDTDRLATMHQLVDKLITTACQTDRWSVVSSTERRELLPGSNYTVCCVEVSGLDCVQLDNDIPLSFGIDQCIGDTIGPGGLFKAFRTIPVYLDILRDIRELCPDALMLNYTNPMSMMCLAAGRAVPEVNTVGLCHSVQDTSHSLAHYADVPYDELTWRCAGINHLAWFTTLEHQGRDLYTSVLYDKFAHELAQAMHEHDAGITAMDARDDDTDAPWQHRDLVRKDICLHFNAFITESSGHLSEYLPYYRKSDAGRKYLRTRYDGGSRFYATNWPHWRQQADRERQSRLDNPIKTPFDRSWEYASWIIEAIEKTSPSPSTATS